MIPSVDIYCYLVVGKSAKYSRPRIRLARKTPSLKSDEVAIQVNLTLPGELFTRPQLKADIVIPKDSVSPAIISADIQDNIIETMNKTLGIDLKIQLVEECNDST